MGLSRHLRTFMSVIDHCWLIKKNIYVDADDAVDALNSN